MSACPRFLFRLGMSDTQKNREAIQAMKDADGAGIAAEDQAELLEQALVNSVMGPESIRSQTGEEITYRNAQQIIEADKYLASKAASTKAHRGLMFSQLIPPGGGGTP